VDAVASSIKPLLKKNLCKQRKEGQWSSTRYYLGKKTAFFYGNNGNAQKETKGQYFCKHCMPHETKHDENLENIKKNDLNLNIWQ